MLAAVVAVAVHAIVVSIVLSAVLAALVFAITRLEALTATTRHALWTTALVAMAVMPLAGIAVSAVHATRPPAGVASPDVIGGVPNRHHPAMTIPAPEVERQVPSSFAAPPQPSLGERLATLLDTHAITHRITRQVALGVVAVWLVGALIGLAGLAGSVWRVRGLRKRSSPLDGTLADELPWLTEVGPGREIYLRLSYETETPVAIGFRRPVILIPTELATAEGLTAIEALVLHEHAHLRRYDDWTNLVQRTIERIFWFNPIVWLVGRRIALEREIASDDAVVERTGHAKDYAASLWRLAREMRMPEHAVVAPGALLTRKQISIRIEQLLDANRGRLRRSPATALGVVLAAVLAVGFVATSAPAIELPAQSNVYIVLKPATTTNARTESHVATHPKTATKTIVMVERAATPAAAAVEPVPSLPPSARSWVATVPAVPAVPSVPPVAPMPSAAAAAQPEAIASAAASASAASAAMARARAAMRAARAATAAIPSNLPQVQSIVDNATRTAIEESVRASMAAIPSHVKIAHAHSVGDQYDGARVTREIVEYCTGCSFRKADLSGLNLSGLRIAGDDFSGANLRNANLGGARLDGDSLRDADLSGANLAGALINGVELRGANLSNVNLSGARFTGVELRGVDLRGTNLRDVLSHCTGCDMSGMDLRNQDLHDVTLTGADLSNADLRGANLSGSRLAGVDLSGAKLSGANLSNARLDGCDLSNVSLRDVNTSGMILRGSNLDG